MDDARYYRMDLTLVHHRGFAHHAELCADGILALLEPVRGGSVLELGCGSGHLTRELLRAGHRVIATDASPAMLELARREAPGAEIRQLTLPDDPLPAADAIVSVGHVLGYLADAEAIDRALTALARALTPGGVLAIDLCDLRWGELRRNAPNLGLAADDWAVVSMSSVPAPDRVVRDITTFIRNVDGTWRRDDERHINVLVDSSAIPKLLAHHDIRAEVRPAFGGEQLPDGLVALTGRKAR